MLADLTEALEGLEIVGRSGVQVSAYCYRNRTYCEKSHLPEKEGLPPWVQSYQGG